MGSAGILIRSANVADCEALAFLHMTCLPDDPAVLLGEEFLSTRMYPFLLCAPGCAFVAESPEGDVVGYAVFSTVSPLACHGIAAALVGRVLTGKISALKLLANAVSVAAFVVAATGRMPLGPELSWIAVSRQHRQMGVGARLVAAGIHDLKRRGFTSCWVKTLIQGGRTLRFYQGHAFLHVFSAAGRAILEREFHATKSNSATELTP